MKKTCPYLFAIIISCITLACTKKGNTGPTGATGATGPAGPSFKGVINGHVKLYDQYGSRMLNGTDNIELTLKGGKTISPDSKGYFLFDSVNTGTYSIAALGNNFGTTHVPNVQFLSDTLYLPIAMSAKPTFNLSSFKAYYNQGSAYDSLIISVPADTRIRNCIVFVNNTNTVSSKPANYLLTYVKAINPGMTTVQMKIHASELNSAGIFYGERVYFSAYSYVVNDASVYIDRATGNIVYNAVGNAIVDSTICP